ncbi:MAG: hypothetical protein ABI140_08425 [Jatrophihabitantaceae bacterium]
MNDSDLDALIGSALRARAGQLTEADLSPATPPIGRAADQHSGAGRWHRWNWSAPLLAAAAVTVLAVGSTVVVRSLSSTPARPGRPSVGIGTNPPVSQSPSPGRPISSSPGSSSPRPSGSASTSPPRIGDPAPQYDLGYQPLWPFGSYQQATQWIVSYRSQGSQPWHLDAAQTALDFTRSYLGFTELTTVTSSRFDGQGAHIGVGYRNPNGTPVTSAVLHLVRYGQSGESPWEVVGSDDTTFSLEIPSYGSMIGSPVTVGGHLTGVDESIRLSARSLSAGLVSQPVPPIPAGGDNQPWRGQLTVRLGGVLTLIASTGGHLQAVERFAIQGVRS